MDRKDAETQRINDLSKKVIGFLIEIHRALGPGLLESAYEECLCFELAHAGIPFKKQVSLPVQYKGVRLDCGYRIDIMVDDCLILELKAVEKLMPIHEAQLLTYLRLSGKRLGLLVNFNVPVVKDGIKRIANGL
ncbi:MAG: GxxExxY protein [Planctomycetes bacterium]|jgi:GxxExxY protein|nr:GxxExxY protein [Planctomycetota bacterium]